MSQTITAPKPSSEPPKFEEGIYDLTIANVETGESNFGGETKAQVKWTFHPVDATLGFQKATGYTSLSMWEGTDQMPASRLYEWSKVLTIPTTAGENGVTLDITAIIGTVVSALVEKNKRGWPTVKKLYKVKATPSQAQEAIEAAAANIPDAWDSE